MSVSSTPTVDAAFQLSTTDQSVEVAPGDTVQIVVNGTLARLSITDVESVFLWDVLTQSFRVAVVSDFRDVDRDDIVAVRIR